MSFSTNQTPITSIVDVISELEKTITYCLQHPSESEGLGPDELVPPTEAPNASQTNLKFFMGEIEKFSHISRPYIVWTGDKLEEAIAWCAAPGEEDNA